MKKTKAQPRSAAARRQRLFLTGFLGVSLASIAFSVVHDNAPSPASAVGALPALTDSGALPRGGILLPGEECVGAQTVTENEFRTRTFNVPVYLPAERSASFTDGWICPRTNAPTAMYGELELTWDPGWETVDASKKFAGLANERDHAEPSSFGAYAGMINYPSASSPYPMAVFVVGDTAVTVRAKYAEDVNDVISLAREIAKSAQVATGRGELAE